MSTHTQGVVLSLRHDANITVDVTHDGSHFILVTRTRHGVTTQTTTPVVTTSRLEAVYFAMRRIVRLRGAA